MITEEALRSYLTFRLGDEYFAANVAKVIEILELPRITKVPRAPEFMTGVINLRGSVLPVIDTRIKFGLPACEPTQSTCIVVMDVVIDDTEMIIGALADSVQEVVELEPSQILPAPEIGAKYKAEFIQGMVKHVDQFIMILDLDKVFSTSDATILQEIVENEIDNSQE